MVLMSKSRRDELRARMGGGVAIFASTPVALRNGDVEHEYRQSSDLYYLTEFDEPESVAVLSAEPDKPALTLFCRVRDPERETWDGPRAGLEGAVATFGADQAFEYKALADELPKLLQNVRRIYYRAGENRAFDDVVFRAIDRVRAQARLGFSAPTEIVDPSVVLHEMRLIKRADELDHMRRAAAATSVGFTAARDVARPGRWEYEVEGELRRAFRAAGSERPAYSPIVGSGPNATILHYRKNGRRMEDGDLLLIDAGAEVDYYACDVTRTFPISGKFTPPQRDVYEIVLEAQLAAIEAVRPGATIDEIHAIAVRRVTEGLVRVGLLEGAVDDLIEKNAFRAYFMHRTSHWLGMDVHDVGAYHVSGKPRPLEPGMVLTVEPGIYISETAPGIDPKWRGIGVRIEDDVLVTANGPDVLTAEIPKSVADLQG